MNKPTRRLMSDSDISRTGKTPESAPVARPAPEAPPAPAPAVSHTPNTRLLEDAFINSAKGDTVRGVTVPGQTTVVPQETGRDYRLLPHIIPAQWLRPVAFREVSQETVTNIRISKNQIDRMERIVELGGYRSRNQFMISAIERALRIAEQEAGLI